VCHHAYIDHALTLPSTELSFQREVKNDRPGFHLKNFVLPYRPESTRRHLSPQSIAFS
jgi:hypothetical protein